MGKSLELILWGLVTLFVAVWLSLNVISGGLLNYAKATLALSPYLFILFLRSRAKWHIWPLVLVSLNHLRIPVYGLQQMSPILLFLVSLLVAYLVDAAVHSEYVARKTRAGLGAGLLLFYSIIITLRFAYDRPGFAALGMERGGFFGGLSFVLAGWSFFLVRRVAANGHFRRGELWLTVVASLVGIATLYRDFRYPWYQELCAAPTWILCASLIPLLTDAVRTSQTLLLMPSTLLILTIGIASRHRARLFYLIGEVLLIAWSWRRLKRTAFILFVAGVLAGSVLLALGGGRLPSFALRSLSLVLPRQLYENRQMAAGAIGWEDSFRVRLYKFAWKRIKENPVFGRGLGLDVEEVLAILAGAHTVEQEAEILEQGSSYHNGIVALAVNAGVPAALFFVLANILIVVRCARWTLHCRDGDRKVWASAALAFWLANMMQINVNGGANELMMCGICLGLMAGLMDQDDRGAAGAQDPVNVRLVDSRPSGNVDVSVPTIV